MSYEDLKKRCKALEGEAELYRDLHEKMAYIANRALDELGRAMEDRKRSHAQPVIRMVTA